MLIVRDAYARKAGFISTALSNPVPDVDAKRFNAHVLNAKNGTSTFVKVTSYDYYVHKLKYPYADNCFNYREEGFHDRWDAINYCYNVRTKGQLLKNVNIYSSDPDIWTRWLGWKTNQLQSIV